MVSNPPSFPPYTNEQLVNTKVASDILRDSTLNTFYTQQVYPHLMGNPVGIPDNYLLLWNFFEPLREAYSNVVKERDEYTKEIEGCYIELEKYKAYFANILPYQANQLTCGICQETSSSYVVLLPCSHTCCVDCGTRLTSCHICRKKINTRQNLYL